MSKFYATLGFILATASSAAAQPSSFPADELFVPGYCGGGLAWDPISDEPGANGARDIVGSAAGAAMSVYDDGTYLFLRQRVAATPELSGGFSSFGWAWAFDTDGDRRTYEVLVLLNGVGNPDSEQLIIAQNTVTGMLGDPSDQPEVEIAAYPASSYATFSVAGTAIGGGTDYFITVAAPRADLTAGGVVEGLSLIWTGTSDNAHSINADIACQDATTGNPVLNEIPIDPVIVGTYVDISAPLDGVTLGDATPTISGVAEPGATLTLVINGGAEVEVTVAADGTWTYTPAGSLPDGATTVVARVVDPEGATDSDSISFSIDSVEGRQDDDGDGYCETGVDTNGDGDCMDAGEETEPVDCNDTDPAVSPGETESCSNATDDDCDGDVDFDDTDCAAWDDIDGDGYCVIGEDLDGDGDCLDAGEDAGNGDCDDTRSAVHPGVAEVCTNTLDDDCDALVDLADPDCAALVDTDGDGVLDGEDADADGDGIPNAVELAGDDDDTDGDGVPNHLDLDADDDTVLDSVEGHDANGDGVADIDPLGVDGDGDGLDAVFDEDEGGTSAAPPDWDGDGVADWLDPDDDDDGLATIDEDVDGDRDPTDDDTDDDGAPNYLDADDDGDGLTTRDEVEDSVLGGDDVDGDGLENWLDPDSDGDGLDDRDEGRTDSDRDGLPDYLDLHSQRPAGGGLAGGALCAVGSAGGARGRPEPAGQAGWLVVAGALVVRRVRRARRGGAA